MTSRPQEQFAIWALVRLMLLAVLLIPFPNREYVASEMVLFSGWTEELAQGRIPDTTSWQYPPGFALLLWMIGSAHLGAAGLIAVVLAADYVILRVLRGTRGGLFWALAPLLMGPIFLMKMDTAVTACAVVALSVATRTASSGFMLGLGASLKVWPFALVIAYPRPDGLRRAAVAAVTYACVAAAALLILRGSGFTDNQGERGLQVESVAAWPFMVARFLGADIPLVFRFGATEVESDLASNVSVALLPLTALALSAVAWKSWRRVESHHPAVLTRIALLVVVLMMVLSRVLSPQFNVWMLGLLALLLAVDRGANSRVVLLAGTSAVAAQILYPHVYLDFLEGGAIGLAVQTVRVAALLWLAGELVRTFRKTCRASTPPHLSESPSEGTQAATD